MVFLLRHDVRRSFGFLKHYELFLALLEVEVLQLVLVVSSLVGLGCPQSHSMVLYITPV